MFWTPYYAAWQSGARFTRAILNPEKNSGGGRGSLVEVRTDRMTSRLTSTGVSRL